MLANILTVNQLLRSRDTCCMAWAQAPLGPEGTRSAWGSENQPSSRVSLLRGLSAPIHELPEKFLFPVAAF